MGLFGWGTKETEQAADRTASQVQSAAKDPKKALSAIEQAQTQKQSGMSAAATRLIERLLDVGIDGKGPFDSADKVADSALKAAGGNVDRAIKLIQRDHRQLAAAGGFATGLGGFFTMPVSLPANILEFYLLGTRMTAATAKLRGYDINQPEIRSAILLTLVGADAEDILKKAGMQAVTGGKLGQMALGQLPKPALMVLNKAIGFRLLGRLGKSTFAKLGRAVPIVGGLIGAGLDVYMLGRIAIQGLKEFPSVNFGTNPAAVQS